MSLTVPGFRALADRAVALAAELCGGRLVAMLEGGYSLLHLPLANLAILEGLAGVAPSFAHDPVGVDVPRALRDVERAAVAAAASGPRGLMLHDAHGFWIADAGSPEVLAALEGDHRADVVVVGGGYTGLWTAWHVLEAEPDADVVVLESGRCGHGPSGRNGGFVTGMDLSLPALRERLRRRGRRGVGRGGARDRGRGRRVVRGRGRRRLVPQGRRAGGVDGSGAGRRRRLRGDRRHHRARPQR